MQESIDRSVPFLCNGQDVDRPDKEDSRASKRHKGNKKDFKRFGNRVAMKHSVSERRTESKPTSPFTEETRLPSTKTRCSSTDNIPPQLVCLENDTFANSISRYIKTARGPRTRTKARAEAATVCEFDSSRHPSCRTRLYSRAEDDLLRNLMDQGLSWDEVEKSFGQRFAGRELRSLQMRWSTILKFTLPSLSTRCSKRKRSCLS